jgi:uncharacterized membrane protein
MSHLLIGSTEIIIKVLSDLDIQFEYDSGDIYISEEDYSNNKIPLAFRGVV